MTDFLDDDFFSDELKAKFIVALMKVQKCKDVVSMRACFVLLVEFLDEAIKLQDAKLQELQ